MLKNIKISLVHKLVLSFVLVVLISSIIVGGLFYLKITQIRVDHALQDIAYDIQNAGRMLQQVINTHDEDVLFLVGTPPVQGLLQSKPGSLDYELWIQRLETIFESQLKRKSTYLSIRYISKAGQEIVHVHRIGSTIIHYRGNKLQNKSNRKYVRETIKLSPGSVYVSEINLNREYGKVIVPFQEVKRSSSPVFNKNTGELSGLIVITINIGHELRSIHQYIGKKDTNLFYITNDRGGYLLHPDNGKTYGFDLGKRYRIQEDFPKLAKFYLPENKDRQVILMPDDWGGNRVVYFTKIPFDPANKKRFIAVILSQDYNSIVKEQSKVLNEVSLWALFLTLLGAGIGVIFAIRITSPIKQMTSSINDFSNHQFNISDLPVDRDDEVGILARSFKSMAGQVSDSHDKLLLLNTNLEKQVYNRTKLLKIREKHQRIVL